MLETFQILAQTFYSKDFYRKLVRQWSGIGIGFILTMVLFSTISFAVRAYGPTGEFAEKVQGIFATLPAVTIKDGKLSIDRPSPWSIDLGKYGDADGKPASDTSRAPSVLTVDTNYKIDDLDALKKKMTKEKIIAFITADKIVTRKNGDKGLQVDDISEGSDVDIDHDKWVEFGQRIRGWFFPILVISGAVAFFCVAFFYTLVVAILVRILAAATKANMDFNASMRLAAAAGIPVSVAVAIFLRLPFWFEALVWLGYVVFGLMAVLRTPRQEVL